jgi:hypothetical protein
MTSSERRQATREGTATLHDLGGDQERTTDEPPDTDRPAVAAQGPEADQRAGTDRAEPDLHGTTSFTVRPDPARTPTDGGGGTAASAGPGDTTHPERWNHGSRDQELRKAARAAGIDVEGLGDEQLIDLLKEHKPSNRLDPSGRSGPDSEGSIT